MRSNIKDQTLTKNYLRKYQFLIDDYELVKAKKHPRYRFVTDFYNAHQTNKQTFLKIITALRPPVIYIRFCLVNEARSGKPAARCLLWNKK